MKRLRHILPFALMLGLLGTAQAQTSSKESNKKSIAKTLDVLGTSLAYLNSYYVDSINIDELSNTAINAMLESLDPYTEYYPKDKAESIRIMTTGAYGGIGAIISQRADSTVIINEPIEGMPADKAGLKAGDVILEIDGVSYRKTTSELTTKALKGEPGSVLKLLVQRPNEKKPRLFTFQREQVVVSPVPYYGLTPQGYGYISLRTFTNRTSKEVQKALEELMSKHQIPGLILDLRGNGGGLMEEAIKVVNLFVPQGKVVVSTRGKAGNPTETSLRTQTKPIAPELPLVVLINGESASAAEIVSGALQDMDRAVVLGTKSFGKGLVQSTLSLPHEGILKLTTAKYYIPSGRCVQRLDYKQSAQGKEIPDSLHQAFRTAAGRIVYDAGGIIPDLSVQQDSVPTMLYYLVGNMDVFDWITNYTQRHKSIASPREFKLSDQEYADFSQMLQTKGFNYDRLSAARLKALRQVTEIEGYSNKVSHLLDSLEQALKPDLEHDLQSLRRHIEDYLSTQIVTRYHYNRGAIERELLTNKAVAEAERILLDSNRYRSILTPAPNNQ